MCVLFFAFKKQSEYPLIVAANRDENYERPTAPAHFWEDEPTILAGRDLMQMGTWLGVSMDGRFAALTNYRDPKESTGKKVSRGQIIQDYLSSNKDSETFLHKLKEHRTSYQGFNLVLGNVDALWYYSNIQDEIKELTPGIYGLSNHFLDTPWPKVERGKEDLKRCIDTSNSIHKDCLFQLLANRDRAIRNELPDTGIGLDWEEKLSSIFIETDQYGTRSSTVMTVDKHRMVDFTERSLIDGEISMAHFTFNISLEKNK
ncbi:NRDE family protein [Pseudalkalibacillus salsuginis]|uniref:NRDE family protein n=1 Tax=Pseudalkalibacillus salsuginis TaxID=2910972 RepID=UPI001F43D0AC|nr:NRDE family protein [Pseudalkalibacillus salsuginis]MCF6411709.1 NRDE family protein [Pseudalkalibacillus salsuginis]